MNSITFFDPIVYFGSNEDKSYSERALEIVDECFYLGKTNRVTVFRHHKNHEKDWATKANHVSHRSWRNIAIKVAFFFTIIPPLLTLATKALLRYCLDVSSIKVQENTSKFGKLPIDLIKEITEFISVDDQSKLAQTQKLMSVAHQNQQRFYAQSMIRLKVRIETLTPETATRETLKELLIKLVTSRAAGHPIHWLPHINTVINYFISDDADDTIDPFIEVHAEITDCLAISQTAISSQQFHQFYKYLIQHKLAKLRPWIGYRILEKYLIKPQLHYAKDVTTRALDEYLTTQAKKHIRSFHGYLVLEVGETLDCELINIDPRTWFGCNHSEYSLWKQPGIQNGAARIPEMLSKILLDRILFLRNRSKQKCRVSMGGRAEAALPRNFTLRLAKRIIQNEMYLFHHNTVNLKESEFICRY